ncbi:MAG TPA: NAD(P)H-dependent oxidoreductase subunit E, partial [Chthoniobacteraceae bacterium]
MSTEVPFPVYTATLVPALHGIQEQYGYLDRDALRAYSEQFDVPLPRLHTVASFFPHFQLLQPKKVVLRICRDMSCALAGSCTMIKNLQSIVDDQVGVEGVSCLGRCDRAPAAMVAVQGAQHEHHYHGRSEKELGDIVKACLRSTPPRRDHDANLPSPFTKGVIDFYNPESPPYAAVNRGLAIRDASLRAAEKALLAAKDWPPGRIEQFRLGALSQMRGDFQGDDEVCDAVRAWQTAEDWAKEKEFGNWSEALLAEIKAADLRGMGGAGIPSIQKLRDVRDGIRTARKRRDDDRGFIVVNGDESEPGTFKDRELLLRTPHLVVEAVILSGLITEATQGFIYIRHEYTEQIEACRAEIQRAEQFGLCGMAASKLGRPFPLSVFVSPGGYICGEQSALIEAMSDRRAEPRNMPPKLESNGLDDMPTLVSNVETFAWMPYIVVKGGKTYAEHGVNGWQGRRLFSISGDLNRPGVYEAPMGLTLRELVEGQEYCRGVRDGKKLKAFAPSGPSGGFLPAKLTTAAGLPRNLATNKAWQALAGRR